MLACRKHSTVQLVKRLEYSNLLGLDVNLKSGSFTKRGFLLRKILIDDLAKPKFPREVLLCRVGDFYEALGIDACILIEYGGLNPFGGLRSDSIPRAGCPVANLQQTLDDLTRNGYSVCDNTEVPQCLSVIRIFLETTYSRIFLKNNGPKCRVEEVEGPTQASSCKSRFIFGYLFVCYLVRSGGEDEERKREMGNKKELVWRIDESMPKRGREGGGHAHHGSPYVFGCGGVDHDLHFPEPMPVIKGCFGRDHTEFHIHVIRFIYCF
ncbi:hypothetical protein FNV43_RR02219 [Rhamnella rubrinervis]|uniref:DNA mismatch repair protein MutS-like N-terminal domain-containing protein n=1 Tax=Rhamnella rubrinervis TaxID=2594499 RepID=A0A8K0HR32_9ROSA|nr:hypothetical protein FNV43_RR02219 [Rhamnella rubrinervis]